MGLGRGRKRTASSGKLISGHAKLWINGELVNVSGMILEGKVGTQPAPTVKEEEGEEENLKGNKVHVEPNSFPRRLNSEHFYTTP